MSAISKGQFSSRRVNENGELERSPRKQDTFLNRTIDGDLADNIEEMSYEDAKSEKEDAKPAEALDKEFEESGDAATVATSAICEDQSMVEGQQQEQEDKFAKYEEEYQKLMSELEEEKQEQMRIT